MRDYHKQIKNTLIQTYLPRLTILDIGFGYGGPIHQFEKANVKFVLGIEPDPEHIAVAEKRLSGKSVEFQRKVFIVHAGAQDTKTIMKTFQQLQLAKLDAAVSFVSLTFFYESKAVFEGLMNTIKKSIHGQGLFIGTCMDGAATHEYLKELKLGERIEKKNEFYIAKEYDSKEQQEDVFGKKILIHMDQTIVEAQVEYLVDFEYLCKQLHTMNYELLDSKMFNPPSQACILSKLFRYFVFRKT
jgi:hypothetical protein